MRELRVPNYEITAARMMGKTSTAIITFKGLHVPSQVIFGGGVYRCVPHRPKAPFCSTCFAIGHRSDVCRDSGKPRCGTCGRMVGDPLDDHDCKPGCPNCGKDHKADDPTCEVRQAADKAVREAAYLKLLQQREDVKGTPSLSQEEAQTQNATPTTYRQTEAVNSPGAVSIQGLQSIQGPQPIQEPRPVLGPQPVWELQPGAAASPGTAAGPEGATSLRITDRPEANNRSNPQSSKTRVSHPAPSLAYPSPMHLKFSHELKKVSRDYKNALLQTRRPIRTSTLASQSLEPTEEMDMQSEAHPPEATLLTDTAQPLAQEVEPASLQPAMKKG
ncbi:hypothetical protein HPB49_016677 [Dermacentor silvarum]|uniref:Uncharacterized protein n=1 Tax=Dermacentor silvarum TaxID=543639 RepID=A0ACB8CY68_DERSI|nr:hypothetical protein HPB49_016677 [Dermacentor silvarum]